MLSAWGRSVYRRRVIALVSSGALLVLTLAALSQGGQLLTYQPPKGAESTNAIDLVTKELPGFSESSFFLVLSGPNMDARSDAFRAALDAAVQPLRDDARVGTVVTPYGPRGIMDALISKDGHRALVLVGLKAPHDVARLQYASIRAAVHSETLQVLAGGELAVNSDFEATLQKDLERAEILSFPLTLLLLLVVFGTLVAALLPLGVGLLAVLGGVASVMVASHFTDISVYALNIVTLIGLGVAIDYSLFIVSRFREETARGKDTEDALARTLATAGRAVAFSGLTVAVGLLGLAFYRGMYFASMGIAGALVVTFAVLYALVFLPALLALLGKRIEKGRVPFLRGGSAADRGGRGLWHTVAMGVMKRPVIVLLATTFVVVLAASPFLGIHIASLTEKALPESAEARRGTDLARREFPDSGSTTFSVVVQFAGGDPLTRDRVGALFDLSRTIATIPGIQSVRSIVDLDPSITREQYQAMYADGGQGQGQGQGAAQAAVQRYVGEHIVLLQVFSAAPKESDAARAIVHALREHRDVADGRALVTGATAFDVDTLALLYEYTPWAMAFVVAATYLLLLLQTGSVVLPAKAILMNFLSIGASFGAIVWIFQEGNLGMFLDFTAAPIDPALPVLMFCIVFGLSMDYEVMLLSRMHEEFDRHGDNTRAVADGLEKSGHLITSAAAIMVIVFASFGTAQVTLIKAIGLGLAIAIAVDATLVRGLIVPAAMRLMGKWNWWSPTWMRRFLVPAEH